MKKRMEERENNKTKWDKIRKEKKQLKKERKINERQNRNKRYQGNE